MTEYEEYCLNNNTRPEDVLKSLKQERHSYQLKIDKAITQLEQWTIAKNSKHFQINKLKRMIREHESTMQGGRWGSG